MRIKNKESRKSTTFVKAMYTLPHGGFKTRVGRRNQSKRVLYYWNGRML